MNNEPNRASNGPVKFLIPEAHAHTSIKADNITTKLGRNSLLSVRTQPTTPHHHYWRQLRLSKWPCMLYMKSQKGFLNESKGWNRQKPAKQDGNDTTTRSHHPILFDWFLMVPSLHRLFSFRKLFCDLFLFFFLLLLLLLLFFRNSKREERSERRPRGKCMVCKVQKYRTLLFTRNHKNKFKCLHVKMYI